MYRGRRIWDARAFRSLAGRIERAGLVLGHSKQKNRNALLLVLILSLLATAISSFSPMALARLSSEARQESSTILILIYLFTVVIPLGLNHHLGMIISVVAPKMTGDLRFELVKLLTLMTSREHEKLSTPAKYSIIEADVTRAEKVLRNCVTTLPQYAIRLISILLIVLLFKAEFFYLFLTTCVVLTCVVLYPGRNFAIYASKAQRTSHIATSMADKLLVHQRLISGVGRNDAAVESVLTAFKAAHTAARASELRSQLVASIPQLFVTILMVSVLALASGSIGLISTAMVFALVMYSEQILVPISMLAAQVAELRTNYPGVRTVSRYLRSAPDFSTNHRRSEELVSLQFFLKEVEIFSGPLPDFLVIMAPNGAGKTTSLREICALTPSAGGSRISNANGNPLKNLKDRSIYIDSHSREIFSNLYPGVEDPFFGFLLDQEQWEDIELLCLDEVLDSFINPATIRKAAKKLHHLPIAKIITTHEPWIYEMLCNAGAVGIAIHE